MSRRKNYDLEELLLQSQRLNSQLSDGESGARRLRRRVAELHEKLKDLAEGDAPQLSEKMGQRLLLSRGYDADSLTEEINTMDFEIIENAAEKLESTDIEGYLAHHHDMIILGAIEDARRAAEDDAQDAERR